MQDVIIIGCVQIICIKVRLRVEHINDATLHEI